MTTPAYAALAERAPSRTASRAADDLFAIREQWGDLLAAIARQPAADWPPRDSRAYIDGHLDVQDDDEHQDDEPAIGRAPLTLREHPAPVNLTALDAALDVERDLFDLADQLAAQAQRPVRTGRDRHGRFVRDEDDAADPARWTCTYHRDAGPAAAVAPGSRAYGLHWAAVWVEGRLLGEAVDEGLFTAIPARVIDEAAAIVSEARRTVERALERDGRTTVLDDPCPSCGGELAARTRSGGEPSVSCSTGEACAAPTPLERGRRTWHGYAGLAALAALDAARRKAAEHRPHPHLMKPLHGIL
ncbi:hypothetical protein ACTVZO_22235 [Streptomyces sp. IBSNAI002]|uniref:hypothetical protein n=1 Tax=Streptomyces sp. IBSNAI002 TaxID=3457500 RepID=UPI003FCEF45D